MVVAVVAVVMMVVAGPVLRTTNIMPVMAGRKEGRKEGGREGRRE